MKLIDNLYGQASSCTTLEQIRDRHHRIFFDILLFIGWLVCAPAGALTGMNTVLSAALLLCIVMSFGDENLYVYAALFMFMRYYMLIGDEPVYRLYSYLITLRFVIDVPKMKFRIVYLPALLVFILHCLFAVTPIDNIRNAISTVIDVALAYIVLMRVLMDDRLFRKWLFMFLMGGVLSGLYGWLNSEVAVNINVAGAGVHTVSRNFGALGDANFAGLFYALCIIVAMVLKGVPKMLRLALVAMFIVLILQTASLSALLTLATLSVFVIILKFRGKSIPILLIGGLVGIIGLSILLTVPWFQQIEAIAGLIIRINEKLSYLTRGRWDLLTTDRWDLWSAALEIFAKKPLWGQLIGGSVITIMITQPGIKFACHNSYIQALLNFGVLGTLMIYLPLFATFGYRILTHFVNPKGYEKEDIMIIRLAIMFGFIVFGMSVDFFLDWAYIIFYFI